MSYSEANVDYAWDVIEAHQKTGANMAVVFRKPTTEHSLPIDSALLDGDKDDLRFLDAPMSVVALYAKGDAKKDATGFVIDSEVVA